MGDFVRQTEIEGEGSSYTAQLSRDWEIWGPNGGYIAAIALRAAGAASQFARPVSFSGHFLGVAAFESVDIEVQTLRAAKRAESLLVNITQHDRAIFSAMVWATVEEGEGMEHDATQIPEVPFPDALKTVEELVEPADLAERSPFWNNFDAKPVDFIPWDQRRDGPPKWLEWYRYRPRATGGDLFADAARSLLLIDTMLWPAAHQAHVGQLEYVAPSIDVTAHFHRLDPDSEWLLTEAEAPLATGGRIGGQARIWSQTGQLLASGCGHLLCRPLRR